jgi:hypothetical protein
MDAKLFRLPTTPNYYTSVSAAAPFDPAFEGRRQQLPTMDSRFPGWAAPLADGRLVTDYSPRCTKNVPAGRQFATKEWMTKHAGQIISITRDRQARATGAVYGLDPSVVPPAEGIRRCTASECQLVATDAPGGIGIERLDEAPDLFGTWMTTPTGRAPAAKLGITQAFMGGRNTPSNVRAARPELR